MAYNTLKCLFVLAALLTTPSLVAAQDPVSTSVPGTVVIEWTTESEVDLAGFNIYRSESRDGPYVKINSELIPASPDPIAGGSYSYADSTAEAGVAYYYKLEDVELDGKTATHGPIRVVATAESAAQPSTAGVLAVILLATLLGAVALWLTSRTSRPASP